MPVLLKLDIEPICYIFYNERGTDFFINPIKYQEKHEIIKQANIDIYELERYFEPLYNDLEVNHCITYHKTDSLYITFIKTTSDVFDF